MLTWVLRHRHHLRALYGLPPEPAMAELMALAAGDDGASPDPDEPALEAPGAPTPAKRGKLPVVVLSPARRRA